MTFHFNGSSYRTLHYSLSLSLIVTLSEYFNLNSLLLQFSWERHSSHTHNQLNSPSTNLQMSLTINFINAFGMNSNETMTATFFFKIFIKIIPVFVRCLHTTSYHSKMFITTNITSSMKHFQIWRTVHLSSGSRSLSVIYFSVGLLFMIHLC